jgi:membrane protein YqaA with SNARE-associated domain
LPVPLEVLVLKLWQRWAVGFGWMKSGFGLGEKPCWGFGSGERGVERVGVWGVGVEWVSGVGVDRWCALGGWSSCALELSGCVVGGAVWVVA